MIITNTTQEFIDQYKINGNGLKSGELYYVKEDGGSLHMKTSDITGELEEYEFDSPKSDGITLGYEGIYDLPQGWNTLDWIKTGFFELYIQSDGPEWRNVIFHAKVDNEDNIITITKCFTKEYIHLYGKEGTIGLIQYFIDNNGIAYRTCMGNEDGNDATIAINSIQEIDDVIAVYNDIAHQCWANVYHDDPFPYTIVINPESMQEEDVDFDNIIKVIIG